MKDIIEIPVLVDSTETIEKLFNNTAKRYSGFMHYEMQVSDSESIYLYFLTANDRGDNLHIWDLLIPKAPACLLTAQREDDLKDIAESYKKRYETPLFLISERKGTKENTGSAEDQPYDAVVSYDPENGMPLKSMVREALNLLLSGYKEKNK